MYDFEHNLAMAYGDEFNPNEVLAYQLREFADEVGMNHKLVAKVLLKQSTMIMKILAEPIISNEILDKEELEFLAKLSVFIRKRAEKFKDIAKEIPFVSF
jgi:serine/threonine-protein kinase HipA